MECEMDGRVSAPFRPALDGASIKNHSQNAKSFFVHRIASPCIHQQHQSKATKRLVFWMFGKGCAIKNRTENQKIKKTVDRRTGPKKNSNLCLAKKKFPLEPLGKKNLSSLLGEKRKRRKSKKNSQDPEILSKKHQVFSAPRVASPCIHRNSHLKATKDLCFFG